MYLHIRTQYHHDILGGAQYGSYFESWADTVNPIPRQTQHDGDGGYSDRYYLVHFTGTDYSKCNDSHGESHKLRLRYLDRAQVVMLHPTWVGARWL